MSDPLEVPTILEVQPKAKGTGAVLSIVYGQNYFSVEIDYDDLFLLSNDIARANSDLNSYLRRMEKVK